MIQVSHEEQVPSHHLRWSNRYIPMAFHPQPTHLGQIPYIGTHPTKYFAGDMGTVKTSPMNQFKSM